MTEVTGAVSRKRIATKKWILVTAALAYFMMWTITAVLQVLRAESLGGAAAALFAPSSWLSISIEVLRILAIAACWLGSIYLWVELGGTGLVRVFAVLCLAIFGMLVGPFYILWNARKLGQPQEGSSTI